MADKSMSGSPHFRSHFVSGSEIDWELATGEYTCKTKYIYIYINKLCRRRFNDSRLYANWSSRLLADVIKHFELKI